MLTHPARSSQRPGAAAGGVRPLLLSLLLLPLLACAPLDDAVTPLLEPAATLSCPDGPALALDLLHDGTPVASCGAQTHRYDPDKGAFTPWQPFATSAVQTTPLPLTRLYSPDGSVHLLHADGSLSGDRVDFHEDDLTANLYRLHRPGADALPPGAILHAWGTAKGEATLSAGAGLLLTDPDGQQTTSPFTARLLPLPGQRPLHLQDFNAVADGHLAFLVYPDGPEAPYQALPDLLAQGARNTEPTGPLIASGATFKSKLHLRALPLGRRHLLIAAPGDTPTLWLFVQHPERHEMTRHVSPDWGVSFVDAGYFNLTPIAGEGSSRRAAVLGLDERGHVALTLHGQGELARYAHLDLPGFDPQAPARITLDDAPHPRWLAVAQGPRVHLIDLSGLGADKRALAWYLPLSLLGLLVLAGSIYRIRQERRLKAHFDAKAKALKEGVHWEERLPPSGPAT